MDSPPLEHLLALSSSKFASLGRQAFLADGDAKGSGIAAELYADFFRRGRWSPAAHGLSAASVARWNRVVATESPLTVVNEQRETDLISGETAKVVFQLADGHRVETVLVPMGSGDQGRATLCVSSQAGCAMACAFCETGNAGLARNLSAAEIVAQVYVARFQLGWEFTSLVFMGMGEPLDNLDNLLTALRVLQDQRGLAFAQERLSVCTVGLTEGIRQLGMQPWKRMGLSLSLNAARQDLRERLMPAARSNPLEDLQRELAAFPRRRNFVLALNWCLLPGVNNTERDAQECAEFARPLGRVLVNVIPYNPGSRPLTTVPTEEEIDAFLELLKANGVNARLRGPKGRSIQAACGQLGGALP